MRLLIKFQNTAVDGVFSYKQNQLQGLVYNLIRLAGYSGLHRLGQGLPRFFNFSELFLTKGGDLALIICSPIREVISALKRVLDAKGSVYVGDRVLDVKGLEVFEVKIREPIYIRTETPVIVRIRSDRYREYGVSSELKASYFYWRPGKYCSVLEPFVVRLEANIYRKYRLFRSMVFRGSYSKGVEFLESAEGRVVEKPIFMRFRYIKTVDVPYYKGDRKISRIGTIWEFELNPGLRGDFLRFIIDTGIGELNSQGYGFVNIVERMGED
jgi:CRISPR-associated endoribonuclease Cas6